MYKGTVNMLIDFKPAQDRSLMPIMEAMTEAWGEDPQEDGEEVGVITNEDPYDENLIELEAAAPEAAEAPEAPAAEPLVTIAPSAEPLTLPETPADTTSLPVLPAAPACHGSEISNAKALELLQREMDKLRNLTLHRDILIKTCVIHIFYIVNNHNLTNPRKQLHDRRAARAASFRAVAHRPWAALESMGMHGCMLE